MQALILESLSEAEGIPVIPNEAMAFYKQNCIVCFDNQKHNSGVEIDVEYHDHKTFSVIWSGEIDNALRKAYGDLIRATDFGAITVALLLVREVTEYTAVEQSVVGTTIDYYLSRKMDDPDLIFNYSARLEVSGILQENENNTIEKRIREKRRRLIPDKSLTTFIIVVEFSYPCSKIVEV